MEKQNETNKDTFSSFNLKFELLRGLHSLDFEEPTTLQKKILSELLSSKNIFVKSPSATGKTISFVIYSLQKIARTKADNVQCIILTHTRDRALRINSIYKSISKYMKVRIHALIGGTIKDDIEKISNGVHIIIGTPGRVIEMIKKKILLLNEITFIVIDDIKQIIERDFTQIVGNLLKQVSEKCQKAFFLSYSEENNKFDNNKNSTDNEPFVLSEENKKILQIGENTEVIDNIPENNKQKLIGYKIYQISLKEEWKLDILLNLYKLMEISQSIIYCNTQIACDELNKNLSSKGFVCNSLFDDKLKILSNFKNGLIRILIATNEISSKEVDLYNNSIIINYEITESIEDFIKRVGRYEFFGKEGIIINFITEKEKNFINVLEGAVGYKIPELPIELSNILS